MQRPIYLSKGESFRFNASGEQRRRECLGGLLQIRDYIAEMGEKPLKGVFFMVIPEDTGEVDGFVAGNVEALLANIDKFVEALEQQTGGAS